MKNNNDLRIAFIASIAEGDTQRAHMLAHAIKAQNKPACCLMIEYKDNTYTIDGKPYNRPEFQAHISNLHQRYNLKYYFIDNSPAPDATHWDFIPTNMGNTIDAVIIY